MTPAEREKLRHEIMGRHPDLFVLYDDGSLIEGPAPSAPDLRVPVAHCARCHAKLSRQDHTNGWRCGGCGRIVTDQGAYFAHVRDIGGLLIYTR